MKEQQQEENKDVEARAAWARVKKHFLTHIFDYNFEVLKCPNWYWPSGVTLAHILYEFFAWIFSRVEESFASAKGG